MLRRIASLILMIIVFSVPANASAEAPVGELARLLTGTNPPGSTLEETALGDVTADAVRWATDADVAIVNGGYIVANLQPGEVYEQDIISLFSKPEKLVVLTMTQSELKECLEIGVSHIQVGPDEKIDVAESKFDGFPQVSGVSFRYDPSAPIGKRIMDMETEETGGQLTVACTLEMAQGAFGYIPHEEWQETDYDLVSAVISFFSGRTIEYPELNRSQCVGTVDNSIIKQYPALLFLLVGAGLFILYFRGFKKQKWLDF